MAPAGPQGWSALDDWVDDSAAAAGRFFEAGKKPARPGSKRWATAGWSESPPIVADEYDPWLKLPLLHNAQSLCTQLTAANEPMS